MANLKTIYTEQIVKNLMDQGGYPNVLSVPRIEKIVVNVGLGEAVANPKIIEIVANELAQIIGQKPYITRAGRAISSFRLRKGDPIGLKVTLRGARMYGFLEKLIKIVLPRLRDFRGIPQKGFDGRGNYTLGLTEHTVFHELDYSKVDKVRGLEVSIVTSAKTDEEAKTLFEKLGLPFEKMND